MGILIKAPTRRTDPGLSLAMPAANGDMRVSLHIREVVRITGLRREQLYMWQRRYGFPNPARDGFGDRVYPPDQVARLKANCRTICRSCWSAKGLGDFSSKR